MQGLIGPRKRKKNTVLDMDALKQKTAESLITAAGIAAGVTTGYLLTEEIRHHRVMRQKMINEFYRNNKKSTRHGKKGKKGKGHHLPPYYFS